MPQSRGEDFLEKKHFHSRHLQCWLINTIYLLVWSMPWSKKEDFHLMYFHYKTYVATLLHKIPSPALGVTTFKIW